MIAQETNGSAEAEQDDEFASRIGARLSEILEHGSRLAEVRAERARRVFVRKAVGLGLLAAAGLVATTLALLAAWQFARGLSQGLGALTGQAWLGDLLSGVLLLGLVLGAGALAMARGKPRGKAAPDALELEEHEAWEGLKRSATQLGEDVVRASALRERVREHPYVSLGAALAAGFATAPLVQDGLRQTGPLLRSLARRWFRSRA